MNRALAEKIANTVLYEGYMLYPYRPSSLKNRQRWNFGTLYPPHYDEVLRGAERSTMHVECLLAAPQGQALVAEQESEPNPRTPIESNRRTPIETSPAGTPRATISAHLRFLQLSPLNTNEWNETFERSLEFQDTQTFDFPGICGAIRFAAEPLHDVFKLTLDLANETELDPAAPRDQALLHSMLSAHLILYAEGAEFISLLDPPDHLRPAAAACHNLGCFPVLVGEQGQRDMLLCSPIILYDYPQIAPESAGDFFDSTEMDEMLTLRVLTLTPEEKQAMRDSGERARQLLERTEQSAREQLAKIHGAVRSMRPIDEP